MKSMPLQLLWEGVVDEVGPNSFWATLHSILDRELDKEIVEIDFQQIARRYRKDIKPGTIFYWALGGSNKAKNGTSLIGLSKNKWKEADVNKAKKEFEYAHKQQMNAPETVPVPAWKQPFGWVPKRPCDDCGGNGMAEMVYRRDELVDWDDCDRCNATGEEPVSD